VENVILYHTSAIVAMAVTILTGTLIINVVIAGIIVEKMIL
jgi:hypothetical protein